MQTADPAELFVALLLAHLVGDFVLRSAAVVRAQNDGRIVGFLLHGAIHFGLCLLVLAWPLGTSVFQLSTLGLVGGLILVHLAIDFIGRTRSSKLWSSGAAQAAHLLVIGGVVFGISGGRGVGSEPVFAWLDAHRLAVLSTAAAYVGVIFGGGYLIRRTLQMLGTAKPAAFPTAALEERSAATGMYIGWLERFLILTALLARSPEAAALIVAAKSIVRYPEFSRHEFAEYFLIGTLLSVAIAVVGGLVLVRILYGRFDFQ